MQKEVKKFEVRKFRVVNSGIYGDYLLINCGRFIKYALLSKCKNSTADQIRNPKAIEDYHKRDEDNDKFNEVKINFRKNYYIQYVYSTCRSNVI